jgi:hypothetical protein
MRLLGSGTQNFRLQRVKAPRPITQEVIGVLAVLNALRAAWPPTVIHDL